MITKLSNTAVNFLLKRDIIKNDEKELYSYGLFILISYVGFFLVALLIGFILKIPFYAIIFYISFCSVRGFAGGIHASTELKCDIFTTASIIVSEAIIKLLITNRFTNISLVILAVASVLLIALNPVDTPQKPLSASQKSQLHKKSTALTVLYCFLSVLFLFIKFPGVTVALATALALAATLLVLGKLKNEFFAT